MAMWSGLALASTVTQHHPDFYIGIGLSRNFADLDSSQLSTVANANGVLVEQNRNEGDKSAEGLNGKLFLGYGKTIKKHYYLGAEVFASMGSFAGEISNNTGLIQFPVFGVNVSYNGLDKVELKKTYGIDFIPGIIVSPGSMIFLRVGYVNSRFELSSFRVDSPADPSLATQPSFDKHKGGIQLGIGDNLAISKHLSLRESYNWEYYGSMSANVLDVVNPTNGNQQSYTTTIKPQVESFTLAAIYHFIPSANIDHTVLPISTGKVYYAGIALSRDALSAHYTQTQFADLSFLGPNTFVKINNSFDWKARGWDGEVFAGIGHNFYRRYYLGLEVLGSLSDTKGEVSSINRDEARHQGETARQDYTFELNNSYGISLISGYHVSSAALFYVRVGVVRSHFRFSDKFTVTPPRASGLADDEAKFNQVANVNKTGLQIGIGINTRVSKKVSIRSEFDVTKYNSFGISKTVGIDSADNRLCGITLDQFKVAAIYHFWT